MYKPYLMYGVALAAAGLYLFGWCVGCFAWLVAEPGSDFHRDYWALGVLPFIACVAFLLGFVEEEKAKK